MKKNRFDLQLFNDSDFFKQAFEEAYKEEEKVDNIVESDLKGSENPSDDKDDVIVDKVEETPPVVEEKVEAPPITQEDLIKAIQEATNQEKPQMDPETEQALELMAYLKENPHLVQAMREVDIEGHQELNSFVPDEVTKKIQELEEFMLEQQYQKLITEITTKYPDFDEEKVINYAQEHGLDDLEVAYKALKSDTIQGMDLEAERAKIREEERAKILSELRKDATNTSTIVDSNGTSPIMQTETVISQQEKNVAFNLGMSSEEYIKWRDGK